MELPGFLNDFTLLELLLAATMLFAAYFVRGITGFGSALVAVPLLLFILPFKTVIPLIVALDYIAAASHGVQQRQAIRWRDIIPLLPFTLAGVLTAIYLLKSVDVELLLSVLGGFIMLYALYSLRPLAVQRQHSRLWAIPAGSLGGLIGTLFATGGPFYVIYLKLRGLDKTAFRSTIAIIFFLDGGMRVIGFILTGLYDVKLLLILIVSLPVMALAMYAGGHIHTSISQHNFQRIISLILLGSGLGLILK